MLDKWFDKPGICAKGNYEISILWKKGRLEKACILSKSGGPCTLRYKDSTLTLKTVKKEENMRLPLDGNQLTLISTLII